MCGEETLCPVQPKCELTKLVKVVSTATGAGVGSGSGVTVAALLMDLRVCKQFLDFHFLFLFFGFVDATVCCLR